jgi:hypothetical protein
MANAERIESAVASPPAPRWSAATRLAFRFSVVYLGLTILTTQLFSAVFMLPSPRFLTGFNDLLAWVGTHVFQISGPIPVEFTGSGDTLLNWVLTGTLLIIAACVTAVWSLVSRHNSYPRMNKWFRLLVRFALGATLVRYGFGKLIPVQMPTVFLARLVEPFGDFSPMGVLWSSIGASPAYEMCVGALEAIPGILLFVPRTTLLGALLALAATAGVFVLNMTYDVPVKLLSFHLVLMSLFLLAPYGRNLRDLLLLNRPLVPVQEPPIGRTPRRRRHWVVAQTAYGALIVLLAIAAALSLWSRTGPNAEKSPLFGIWDVQLMTVDGEVRPPLLTDKARWRRVIMQAPTAAVFQKMDDSFEHYTTEFGTDGKTLTIKPASGNGTSTVTYERLSPTLMVIDGTIDGRVIRLELTPRDLNSFVLNSRGFNWVQNVPFNR